MLVLWPSGSPSPFHHSHATVRSIPQHPAYTGTQYEHIHSTPTHEHGHRTTVRTHTPYTGMNTSIPHACPTPMNSRQQATAAIPQGAPQAHTLAILRYVFSSFVQVRENLFANSKRFLLNFGSHFSQVQKQMFSGLDHIVLKSKSKSSHRRITSLLSPERNPFRIRSHIFQVHNEIFS